MLRSLRDGAKSGWLKYILLGLLVLAGGGLVLTDVGGFFRGGASNNIVAKGKGIEISTAQFDRNVRRILSSQGMSPQEAYQLGLINQILNNEIQTQILTLEAHRLGINVSNDTVKKQISKLAEPLATDGVSKSEALKQILRSQGVSEKQFVQSIRQEMGNTILRGALLSGASGITKDEAVALYKYRHEKRDIDAILLTNDTIKGVEEPSEESLQKFYEANKSDFAIAESRTITVATLKKEMLAGKVDISEDDLQDAYEDNIDQYKKEEKRKLQQAILSTQSDAQDVLKNVEKGSDLKKAVQTVTGKDAAYLGENDFEKSGLLEEIADPVFKAKSGDIIGPVQTALGWHVLVLKEVIEPHTEPFEKVKAALKDQRMQERMMDDLVDVANTLDDQLAGGEPLETVAKEMGLTTETISDFNQAGIDAAGNDLFESYQGDKAQILEAAFDFEIGESSPVMELADGRYVTVRVDAIQALAYQPYNSVKAKLKERWMTQEKDLANRARAEDVFAKLKSRASLEDVAKDFGLSVQKYTSLMRVQNPKAPLTYPAIKDIFDAPLNAPLKLTADKGYIIGQVTATHWPETDVDAEEIAKIQAETEELLPQEIMAQYINSLSQKYNVKINERVLQTVYGSAAES